MSDKKFDYVYTAPTQEERREIEDIRKAYLPAEKSVGKLERLRALNKRVNRPPFWAALCFAVLGTLIAGCGMSMVLVGNLLAGGIPVGIAGIAVAVAAYPVYKGIKSRQKKKYGQEIIALSNELLNENNKT